MVKYISNHFTDSHLDHSLKALFAYVTKKENKDRGSGFISLGKMSLLVPKAKLAKFLNDIFTLLEKEIQHVKPKQTGNKTTQNPVTLEVLTCVKMMLRNFGDEFENRFDLVQVINDLFYFGFNKQLIETLTEMAKICNGKYKSVTQIKLLNTISIILTQKTSHFPLGLENMKRPRQQPPESPSNPAIKPDSALYNNSPGSPPK